MNMQTMKPLSTEPSTLVDKAADSTNGAIRSTQNVANAAFDRLSDKVESVRDQAAPVIDRLSSQAEAVARRGVEAVRDTSAQLREKALKVSDSTVEYIKEEPLRSMLMAAATGATLMALIALLGRSRNNV